ncbi:MAG: ATP-dependent DNA helicase RecG, partial [Chthoniobacterales bacterium]
RVFGGDLVTRLRASLPFAFTASQDKVLEEIVHDLAAPRRMNRLLQGDVGSGKTLVALAAMLHVVESGGEAVLMAPTQILAEQHFLGFRRLLDPLGIPVALRTAARTEDNTPLPLFSNSSNSMPSPRVIVGTHALLFDSKETIRPGLVVIDEQHKFGVLQRARLIERGDACDVLVMTATPIPRTFTQTLYGDLEVSILREKPAARGEIVTAVRPEAKLPEVVDFVRKQLDRGRQAFIVYPLVEESEKLEAKAATEEFEKWKELLSTHTIGLLHGRLAPEEKERAMEQFRSGQIGALVATTVVEVGVDIPNANLMLVENAERFGLAQLHQLRGRIGRGTHKSFCILLHAATAPEDALEKLAVLEATSDGFEIAEADLRLRGPGDLLGTAQTGLPPFRLGDPMKDIELMEDARRQAREIFAHDATMELSSHRRIKEYLAAAPARIEAASG